MKQKCTRVARKVVELSGRAQVLHVEGDKFNLWHFQLKKRKNLRREDDFQERSFHSFCTGLHVLNKKPICVPQRFTEQFPLGFQDN